MKTLSLWTLLLASAWTEDQDKVVHGRPCHPNSHPFQAALFNSGHLICGGVLVDQQWVLTAAHCKKPQLQIYLGKHKLQHQERSEQQVHVARMVVHPNYNPRTHDNDLMMLRLAHPVKISSRIQPVTMETNCSAQKSSCLTLGWGKTEEGVFPNTIHCANVHLVPWADCERAYPGKITRSMVCAKNDEEGSDSCQGDSGGPLICDKRLRGIVSWGDFPCGSKNKPGVYTDICVHVKWIKNVIGSSSPCL
ncbi:kallikrein-6-like [Perognathus longimembris pacificus]|uniref:kallikrein-6-like n=1 Tax=Perognathus longimembris pacificus TaxID=214514 RepID=UPI0020192727|nr:kallikrein-6-like [Perognathus longimembris pacificus]